MGKNFDWENGFDRKFLLKKIAECRKTSNGRCSFDAHEYKFWLPILSTAIRAKTQVGTLKARCITKATTDPRLSLNDPEEFIDRCDGAFLEASKQAKQAFILVCHITYTGPKLFDSISDGACRIVWASAKNRFLAAAYKARDEELSHILRARSVSTNVDGLTPLLVHVEALDYESAVEQAITLVDRLRGLLNLIINAKRPLNLWAALTNPHAVNSFRLGPCRTLHKPNGSLAIKMFWYEPRWSHELKSVEFKGDIKTTKAVVLRWWKKAKCNPLRELISGGLLRYCRALDQHDTDTVLLGLWGALEMLTETQNTTYDITVSRITRLFDDSIAVRQIAQHIRLRRNSTVHAARSPSHDEIDAIIWQAEFLVSQILFFCIREGRKIRSQGDLRPFLDLSLDNGTLRRQRALIGQFINYRKRLSQTS